MWAIRRPNGYRSPEGCLYNIFIMTIHRCVLLDVHWTYFFLHYKCDGSRRLWASIEHLKSYENKISYFFITTLLFKKQPFQRLRIKMTMLWAVCFKNHVWKSNQECGEKESSSKYSLVKLTFSLRRGNNFFGGTSWHILFHWFKEMSFPVPLKVVALLLPEVQG